MTDNLPESLGKTEKPAKTPRIPVKIVQLIDLLTSGKCRSQKAAADQLKLDPSYVSRQLKKVHVATYLQQQTHAAIARSQAPAAGAMLRLLEGAKSEHVQKDVAIHLLGINGHRPTADPSTQVNINIRAGWVIDLSDDPPSKTIDVTPERR
jgi:hypothetical protein